MKPSEVKAAAPRRPAAVGGAELKTVFGLDPGPDALRAAALLDRRAAEKILEAGGFLRRETAPSL